MRSSEPIRRPDRLQPSQHIIKSTVPQLESCRYPSAYPNSSNEISNTLSKHMHLVILAYPTIYLNISERISNWISVLIRSLGTGLVAALRSGSASWHRALRHLQLQMGSHRALNERQASVMCVSRAAPPALRQSAGPASPPASRSPAARLPRNMPANKGRPQRWWGEAGREGW
jgi:hypothetical protein